MKMTLYLELRCDAGAAQAEAARWGTTPAAAAAALARPVPDADVATPNGAGGVATALTDELRCSRVTPRGGGGGGTRRAVGGWACTSMSVTACVRQQKNESLT